MKLTTLGGSAAGIGTRQGCSSYLVQEGATSLLVDIGPGTLLQLRTHVDYRSLDAIVVSHLHADHLADIVSLRFTLAYNPIPAPRPIPLWLPPHGIAMLGRIAQAFDAPDSGIDWFTELFDLREYDPNAKVTVGSLTCSFHPTVHFVPCWAMRIGTGGIRDLAYTADTGPAADLAPFIDGAAVVLAEAADSGTAKIPFQDRGHLTSQEAAQLAAAAGAQTLVLTHLWEEHDIDAALRAAERHFPGLILRAMPGLELRWTS